MSAKAWLLYLSLTHTNTHTRFSSAILTFSCLIYMFHSFLTNPLTIGWLNKPGFIPVLWQQQVRVLVFSSLKAQICLMVWVGYFYKSHFIGKEYKMLTNCAKCWEIILKYCKKLCKSTQNRAKVHHKVVQKCTKLCKNAQSCAKVHKSGESCKKVCKVMQKCA